LNKGKENTKQNATLKVISRTTTKTSEKRILKHNKGESAKDYSKKAVLIQ
jgi:hypothetical protein